MALLSGQLCVDARVVDDVVSVPAARRGLQIGGTVEVTDPEPLQVAGEAGGPLEAEVGGELDAIGRPREDTRHAAAKVTGLSAHGSVRNLEAFGGLALLDLDSPPRVARVTAGYQIPGRPHHGAHRQAFRCRKPLGALAGGLLGFAPAQEDLFAIAERLSHRVVDEVVMTDSASLINPSPFHPQC